MKAEKLFLKQFVATFFVKSRKVRTRRNASIVITNSINDVLKKYYDLKYEFTKEEVEKAFGGSGFQISGVQQEEVPREFWDPGNHLFASYSEFINIKSQVLTDMSHSWKEHKPNYSVGKIETIENLRKRLDEFWRENKALMEVHIKK